jgi:hypothetical protein
MRSAALGFVLGTALAALSSWWQEPLPPTRPLVIDVIAVTPAPLEAWREMNADVLADVALGEDPDALEAVMWTVLNRAGCSHRCPPLELTVRRRRAYGSVIRGRFHPSWTRRPGRRWRWYPAEWAAARRVARDVLEGKVTDPTDGATHFHRRGTWRPPWAPERSAWVLLGQHAFYTEG